MFGSHLSIAGGMHHALIEAQQLGLDCVQVFTKNQRQWKVKPLTPEQIDLWQQHQKKTGIDLTVSHDSYLINLASPDAQAWEKSMALFQEELLRCEALGIPYLVTHPGAHMKQGEEAGLSRIVEALDRLHDLLDDRSVITCLEVTAGQGTSLGWRFEHLRDIIAAAKQPHRLAVCLDTAHMLAAGYDLTSKEGCQQVVAELDTVLGLDRVKVIHLNDSKTPRGSRVDRHEHIGHGHVSLDAFEVLVNQAAFVQTPKIMETPKATAPDGRPWDLVNVGVLRGLIRNADTP